MATTVAIVATFLGLAIKLGKYIAQPINRQLNYLCCFSSNIHDLRDEVKKLVAAKNGLQMRVVAAMNNAEVIVPQVETWLKDMDEIQEKINGIESEITNIQGGSCLAIKSRFSLSKKVKNTTEAMKELRDNCKIDPISERAPPPSMAPLPLGSTTEFESRREVEDDIMTSLKDGKVNMLGICGMGGIGKTTMAKRVMNRARAHSLFDEMLIAVVSQPVDMSNIQKEIAESLGLKLDEETLPARAHKLRSRLMGAKRILIVLDDLWKNLNLEDLGIPRESGFEGCTILLTSRDRDVLNGMCAQQIHEIPTLSNKEAWSLFREKAGVCVDDPNLFSIAKEIVEECKCLPIAIVNVAAALKDKKHRYIWDNARQQLRSSNPVDMPKVLEDVYKPLKLSYDFLDNQNAQSIFLLCCLFPEDSTIRVDDLAAYFWGLQMSEGTEDLEDVRNQTYTLVDVLKSRFLLLEVVSKYEHYVRMHDVVRDVAIFIASKEKQLIRCGANCTWISPFLGQTIEISNGMIFLNLRLLIMIDEADSNISFEGMRDLKVLSMTSISSLPCTTQLLKSLRTLILDSPYLHTISGIGELVNLEILICRNLGIEQLPVEMSRLVHLMKFEISKCDILRTIAPNVISSLVALKELKMVNSFNGWVAKGINRKNATLSELQCLSSLTSLTIRIKDSTLAAQHIGLPSEIVKYHIVIGDTKVRSIRPQQKFEKTMLMYLPREISSLGNWILKFISRVEYLLLEGDGSNIVDLGQAQDIKKLIFRKCSIAKRLVKITISSNGSTTVFPHMEYLELAELDNLEDICHFDGPIPKGSSINAFKNLKILSLNGLPMLKHLWENSSMYHVCLPQLKKLEVSNCEIMEQVFLWNEEEEEEEEEEMIFSKLGTLILRDLPRLTTFSKGIERIKFPRLTDMTIDNCPQMKSFVAITNVVASVVNNNSGGINQQDDCLHLFCNLEKVVFGMLKNLEIGSSNTLKLWCHRISPNSFTGLERLCIRNCGNIRRLFSSPIARNLGNLKTLQIHDCDEMVNVIDDEESAAETSGIVFPRLRQLEMWGLHKLEIFCRNSLELPALKDMHILGCYNMEMFSLGSLITPKLKALKVGFRDITINRSQDLNVALQQPLFIAKEDDSFFNWVLKIKGMETLSELALYLTTDEGRGFLLEIEDCTMATEQINYPSDIFLRYNIAIGNAPSIVYPLSGQHKKFMRLHLPNGDEITLGNWVHQCVRTVEYMWLQGDGSNKVDLRKAQNIRHLAFGNCTTLMKVVNIIATSPIDIDDGRNSCSTATTTHVFPHLEYLELKELPNLQEICPTDDDSPLPASIIDNVFNNLKKLHLGDLPAIKHLWKSSNANCLLQQLQELVIKNCVMMEHVLVWESQGNEKEETESKITITFPALEKLELRDLPMLTAFCKGIESMEFLQLSHMNIYKCPELKSLVPSGNHDGDDDDASLHLFCQPQKVAFGGLKNLSISGCWTISKLSKPWCDKIPTHDFFTGLERLTINDFGKLRSLFSSVIASNLNNLKSLVLLNCYNMVKVIEDDVDEKDASCELSTIRLFPLLEFIGIYSLPRLKIFFEWRSCVVVELSSLRHVKIRPCPKMERFSLGSLITPNLNIIEIDDEYLPVTNGLNVILQQQILRKKKEEMDSKKKKKKKKKEEVEDREITSGEIVQEEEN